MIYKYCRRCGKRLKGAENRLRGYGETCFEKAQKEAEGLTPLLSPTLEQTEKELKRLTEQEQRLKAEQEQTERAKQRLTEQRQRAEQDKETEEKSSNKFFDAGETPHLEKTLNPTFKKPLLFIPPNHPHTPAI